jgi:hypothetical protein
MAQSKKKNCMGSSAFNPRPCMLPKSATHTWLFTLLFMPLLLMAAAGVVVGL